MIRNGWQRGWVRALTTVLTLCMMAVIFAFSTQDAEHSDQTSGQISRAVVSLFYHNYDSETPERQKEIFDTVQHAVRKCAHFTEYTLLGFLLRLCAESWMGHRVQKRWLLLLSALVIGALYAATDECHQLLIDGRSGQWTDVLLDSSGVLCGALIGHRVILKNRNRKRKGEGIDDAEYRSGLS